MVEKLSVTIGLEGGAEIQRQLKDIGTAGQKAFLDIAKAAEQAGGFTKLDPSVVTDKLKTMGLVGTEAFNKITTAVESATRTQKLVESVRAVEDGFASLSIQVLKFAGPGGVLGRLAAAFGPIGLAAAAAFALVTKLSVDAAASIGKVEAAAAKAGLSIEQFDRLRQSLEKAGIPATAVAEGIQKITEAAEKGKLAQVARDVADLQEAARRGFGGPGTEQWARLVATMQGFGPAAEAARKGLTDLGATITGGAQSLDQLAARAGSTREAMAAFIAQLEGIKDPAERNTAAFRQMGEAGLEIARGINTGAISSRKFAEGVASDAGVITQSMANAAAESEQSTNKMSSAWDRFRDNLLGGAVWDSVKASGVAAWEAITAAIAKAYDALLKFLGLRDQGPGGTAPAAPGFASGGPVGGRGSGTSDSNLAWVSRGEHIMPAGAVRQPGVLAFLEALRRSGGNLGGLLNGMGRFAMGGPVGVPALAIGGMVGGANLGTLTLGLPSGGSVSVRASVSVVEQLRHEAAMAQVRSGGRKPSRYT